MGRFHLSYKDSSIAYYHFGSGSKTVFCFHGYGEDGSSFSFLEKFAGDDFCFIAIDLPCHGKTIWNEGDFTPMDLTAIIDRLTQERNSAQSKVILLGFSLGGRAALSLYETINPKPEKLILLAPDGLKINFWYWLATQTIYGKKIFAVTMKHPGWFLGFLKLLHFFRLVNRSIFKFVNYYIGDEEVRQQLYQRWTQLRKLKPNLDQIKKSILSNNTRVRLIYGKHDRIILPAPGERFCKELEDHCKISMIHSGHQVLHENHIAEILPALLND